MSTPVTINLSDEVYRRVEKFALLANRDLSSILSDMLAHNLPLIDTDSNEFQSDSHDKLEAILDLSNEQVMMLTELEMKPLQDAKLSELLDKQQSGTLTPEEPQELEYLMQIYREGLLRKATALAEAVKRGLMEPLDS
jgi:predicted transcriptional regulator